MLTVGPVPVARAGAAATRAARNPWKGHTMTETVSEMTTADCSVSFGGANGTPAHVFAAAVKAVGLAAGKDKSLPVLMTVQLSYDGAGTLTLAATDRYRLHTATVKVDATESVEAWALLVDAKLLIAAVKRFGVRDVFGWLEYDERRGLTVRDFEGAQTLAPVEMPAGRPSCWASA